MGKSEKEEGQKGVKDWPATGETGQGGEGSKTGGRFRKTGAPGETVAACDIWDRK